MRITFELESADLDQFVEVFDRVRRLAIEADEIDILDAAKHALDTLCLSKVPTYVRCRLVHVQRVILMLEDQDWHLPQPERHDALAALAYFGDPDDLIPDHLAGIGLLDDAIMLELLARRMRRVLDMWQRFCAFRAALPEIGDSAVERSQRARALALERVRMLEELQLRRDRRSARLELPGV